MQERVCRNSKGVVGAIRHKLSMDGSQLKLEKHRKHTPNRCALIRDKTIHPTPAAIKSRIITRMAMPAGCILCVCGSVVQTRSIECDKRRW